VHSWTRNLAVVFLGLLGVFLLELSAIASTNSHRKQVLIPDSFGREVAPFNAGAAAFLSTLARQLPDPDVGVQAVRVAVRIFHGEASASIPPEPLGVASPVYDWHGLRRFGIS